MSGVHAPVTTRASAPIDRTVGRACNVAAARALLHPRPPSHAAALGRRRTRSRPGLGGHRKPRKARCGLLSPGPPTPGCAQPVPALRRGPQRSGAQHPPGLPPPPQQVPGPWQGTPSPAPAGAPALAAAPALARRGGQLPWLAGWGPAGHRMPPMPLARPRPPRRAAAGPAGLHPLLRSPGPRALPRGRRPGPGSRRRSRPEPPPALGPRRPAPAPAPEPPLRAPGQRQHRRAQEAAREAPAAARIARAASRVPPGLLAECPGSRWRPRALRRQGLQSCTPAPATAAAAAGHRGPSCRQSCATSAHCRRARHRGAGARHGGSLRAPSRAAHAPPRGPGRGPGPRCR
mmetsp:Transcript_27655/g.87888  ORF Transcript_27655/g.87888 Transcript_27655/m.87888 type:complete len:346 (+) Transcript_27655:164-1201(+)